MQEAGEEDEAEVEYHSRCVYEEECVQGKAEEGDEFFGVIEYGWEDGP